MRLRWTFLSFLLCLTGATGAAAQNVNPVTALKPPTPRPVTPITVPSRFCSESQKATAIATAGLEYQNYFANAVDAAQYEEKVRKLRASYQQKSTDVETWNTLAAKASEAAANSARHQAAGEHNHDAYTRLQRVRVIDCTQLGSVPGQGNGWDLSWSVFGGVGVGSSPSNAILPLPAGLPFTAPNGRPSEVVPTWFLEPGSGLLNGVLGSLGHAARLTALDDVLATYNFGRGISWTVGGRATFGPGPKRPDPKRSRRWLWAGLSGEVSHGDLSAIQEAVVEQANAIFDNLLTNAGSPFADATTITRGDYGQYCDILISGGVELPVGHVGGGQLVFRGGPLFAIPISGSFGMDAQLDYGFIVGGVPFHETDNLSLTFRRSGGFGLEAGVEYRRGRTLFDVTLSGHDREDEIVITAAPVSVAGTQRGTVAFATPPGVNTITINTIPGLLTSLSGSATDHVLLRSSGFPWSLHFTAGFRF